MEEKVESAHDVSDTGLEGGVSHPVIRAEIRHTAVVKMTKSVRNMIYVNRFGEL